MNVPNLITVPEKTGSKDENVPFMLKSEAPDADPDGLNV